MRKLKKTVASLAIVAMMLTMIPMQVFAATTDDTRIAGATRVQTAIAAADAGWTSADTAILAPSADANLVDALAAAPLAGQENAPILLTEGTTLNADTKAELVKLGVSKVYVIGAIDAAVTAQVEAMDGVTATALKGANRYETAAKIAAELNAPAGTFIVGSNATADALSVASYAAANKYAIMLADASGKLPASETKVGSTTYLVGGSTLVADVTGATRLYGDNRYLTNKAVINALNYEYSKVYVANGQNGHLVDSLVASSLAAKTKSPILLTDNKTVDAAADVNKNLTATSKIIALGGTSVVSDTVKGIVKYTAPSALAVESVSANNLKTAAVKFNKAIDDTTLNSTNVKVYKNDTLVAVDGSATSTSVTAGQVGYILSDDSKTLSLEFGTALAQSDKVKVVIDGVKNAAGETISAYTNTVTAVDTTVPSVQSATLKNAKTLELQFSEPASYNITPAQTLTNIKVDGVAAIASVSSDYVSNKITVSLPTALKAGSHTVVVTGIADFANFKSAEQTFTVTAVEDAVAPKMVSAEAMNKDTIKVTFDEDVLTTGTFKVNGANAVAAPVTGHANQRTLTWGSSLDLASIVEVSVKYVGQADALGNAVATEQEFKFSVADDKVVPTVSAQLLTDATKKNNVTLTFSKSMQTTLGTITVKDKDDTVVATLSQPWTFKANTNNTVLELTAAQLGLGSVNPGTYTINVKGFKDNTIRQNALVETNLSVTTIDTKVPTVEANYTLTAGVTTATDKVTFYFNEAMDAATLNNLSNYAVSGGTYGATPTAVSAVSGASVSSVAADNKSVTLVVPSASTAGTVFSVYSLKDTAGNLIATTPGIAKSTATAATVASAKATAANTIKVVFNTAITQVDPSSFKLTNSGDKFNFANAVIDSSDATGKTVLLTVNGSIDANANYTLEDNTGAALTKDIYGNALSASTSVALVDKIAPTLKSVKINNETAGNAGNAVIDLTYDENVTAVSGLAYDLVVRDLTDDVQLVPVTDFTVAASGTKIQITVIKAGVDGHKYSVALNNGRYINDGAATPNHPAVLAVTNVTKADGTDALIIERTAPTALAYATNNASFKVVSATSITVVFSEALDASKFVAGVNGFAVAGGTAALTSVALGADGVTVTLTGTTFLAGTTTVAYTAGTLTDVVGNVLANIGATGTN